MNSVLIVEDNESLGRCVSTFLRSRGLSVTRAASLRDARAELRRERFDAAVLDVGLPDGSGLDLLALTGAERTIVVTANPDPEGFEKHGVQHFLPKPFDLEDVFSALRKVVDV